MAAEDTTTRDAWATGEAQKLITHQPALGRPSKYSDELADKICGMISEGESLVAICALGEMPHRDTVHKWLREQPAFSDSYARAREQQADFYADQIIDIADTCQDPQKARVQIDARKWKASKLQPKRYGDTATINQNTTVSVSDPLMDLLSQVATGGKRLGHDSRD